MSTARERVEQEAKDRFPLSFIEKTSVDFNGNRFPSAGEYNQVGFIEGRTVSAEQIEQAAIYIANVDGLELPCVPDGDEAWGRYRYLARETLRAAGLIVEEARPHERSG